MFKEENSLMEKGSNADYKKKFLFSGYLGPAMEMAYSPSYSKLIKEFKSLFFTCLFFSVISKVFSIYFSVRRTKFLGFAKDGLIHLSDCKKLVINILVFLSLTWLSKFFVKLLEGKIENDSFYFIKKITIKKFFNLEIEDKVSKKADVAMINEEEAWTIAGNWSHIPTHFVASIVKILALFIVEETRDAIFGTRTREIVISTIFIASIAFLNFYFSTGQDKRQKELRIPVKEETYLTEKEVSKSILIDNMGLKRTYSIHRENVVRRLNKKYFGLVVAETTFYSFIFYLGEIFPYLCLFFGASPVQVLFFDAFKSILEAVVHLTDCYKESKLLTFSLGILDEFISLPEMNENESGLKIGEENISSVEFDKVSFSYLNSEENVISEYNNSFVKSKLNKIEGKNGAGKSTILYLILGTVKPQSGGVFVRMEDGRSFDLCKEINLVDWKENIVAYISHENLFEHSKGSTGQKQMMNIDQVISKKKSAQIFLFDEADNSLDENNKSVFYDKINELISKNKIVILISH